MLAIDGLGVGGAEMVVRDLARGLDRTRFDVCICCTKGVTGSIGEQLRQEGHDIFVLPNRRPGRADYLSSLKLRQAARRRNVDVIHTHSPSALLDAAVCKLTLPRLKVAHTFHYGNYPLESWRHHVMEGLLIRAVDRLVAVGHEQRRQVQTTYRLPDSALAVIWNGVAPVAPSEQAAALRTRLGTGDRLLVGTVAKLIEQKGLDDLLAVARKCLDLRYAMQFVIVGDGPLRNSLEQRRRELGLDESVVITGWIPNAAAAAVPAFDVFFQPSRWEAMSIAILEAMAAGKPIVATRVGDNAHALTHQVTGLLVDSGDVPSMVDALGEMNDRDLRQRLGGAAREYFQRQFTVDRMITSYEQLYGDIV